MKLGDGWTTLTGQPPRIIAHRGASGCRPEHTLEGYRLAIEQGSDVIEPDLLPTRDGVLIARHERDLSRSTDVLRRADWQMRSTSTTPWLVEDHSAQQLSELRAVQPFAGRSNEFDRQFSIPEFDQVLELARACGRPDRVIGVYPEIKDPSVLMSKGIDSTALLIAALHAHGVAFADSPVWVQCFELPPLQRVHLACGNPAFALRERLDARALAQLSADAPWLSGIALSKAQLIGIDGDPGLVAQAHALGWQVHVWTLRDDSVLPNHPDVDAEYAALFALGVDALFCDFPESAVRARRRWLLAD